MDQMIGLFYSRQVLCIVNLLNLVCIFQVIISIK